MSRKDYRLIARVLRFRREHALRADCDDVHMQLDILAAMFATELAAADPHFDHGKFLAACGVS